MQAETAIQQLITTTATGPEAWRVLMPLLVPVSYIVYSMSAHYQRPTRALIADQVVFLAGLWLVCTLALQGSMAVRIIVLAPITLFLSAFFVGNKICYRFFKDWVHHQMILEWRMGFPIVVDSRRWTVGWDWIGGVGLPIAAVSASVGYGQPAPVLEATVAAMSLMVIGVVSHARVRSPLFDFDEHNPLMNFFRGWVAEFRGMDEGRAYEAAEKAMLLPPDGFRNAEVKDYPLVREPADAPLSVHPARASDGSFPNVVLIVLETVRALESGCYGAGTSFTPNLDRLAEQGLRFSNFYANGSQTVRAELSLLCSYYDHFSGSPMYMRNPNIRMRSLPEVLSDNEYRTMWISSYSSNFHNKRQFLSQHGVQEIHDDSGMPQGLPKINWGPLDEHLFDYSLEILNRQRSPFFAEIMTLTNHWPFKGPYPTADQTPKVSQEGRYTNYTRGVYYTDHCLGQFMDRARREPWFENTIFVITGDHGAWLYPEDMNLSREQKQEAYFRMPMVFYAPGLIQPNVVDGVTSQVDFAPTLLDLLGIRERNSFVGRSAFDNVPAEKRSALMLHWHSWNLRIGNRFLYTLGKSFDATHHNRGARPDDKQELAQLTRAYFRTDEDLLRVGHPDSLQLLTAQSAEAVIKEVEEYLYLLDFLRIRNRIYDAPMDQTTSVRSSTAATKGVLAAN